jgi:uncharacterized DUF497 family protein
MKYLEWNPEKNERLKAERGFSFEDIQAAIEEGGLLEAFPHPDSEHYPNQSYMTVFMNGYVYGVPFVEQDDRLFLKTAYPSRKHTKLYFSDKNRPSAN